MEGLPESTLNLKKVCDKATLCQRIFFTLCLDILLMLIKNNKNIKGIKMFENTFLCIAYADDSTFFLKDKNSIKELLNTINYFSSFTGLKPNLSKCKVIGVKVAICGIKCIDLTKEAIKILEVFFSYDKNLQPENNFRKTILNIQRILKMWRQRNPTLEGKIIIFETLALSKITFLAQVLEIVNQIIDTLQQMQEDFFMEFIFAESET